MSLLERWRSDSGITLVGNDVSQWVGTEGLVTLEQTTELNRPLFSNNIHNGHSALRFDGAEWLQALLSSDLQLGTKDLTMVAVSRPDTDNSSLYVGKADGTGAVSDAYFLQTGPSEKLNSKVSDGSGNLIQKVGNTGTYDGTGITIHSASLNYSAKGLINHVNGVIDVASTANTGGSLVDVTSSEKFKIGWAGTTESARFDGYIFEIRIYDNVEDLDDLFAELNSFYSGGDVLIRNRSAFLKGRRI